MSQFQEAMLLNIRAEIEALVSVRESMIAANAARAAAGQPPLYGEKSFDDNAASLRCVIPNPHQFGG